MEQNERYVDKLAKYILLAAGIAIVGTLCWYFRSVLVYILIAVVVSLIAKPVMGLLQKMQIKGRKAPDWFLAVISLTIVLGTAMAVIVGIIPIVGSILKDISLVNIENAARSISVPLADLNTFLRQSFPDL